MIYALSRYIIFPNLQKCDWLQIDTEHPQNGPGKLGLSDQGISHPLVPKGGVPWD